MHTREEKMVS